MVRKMFELFFVVCIGLGVVNAADKSSDAIFSGPQPGENVPSLPAEILFGERLGQTIDLTKEAGDKPSVIFFVHQLTRPGFGLMKTITEFAAQRSLEQSQGKTEAASREPNRSGESGSQPKMAVSVVFLTADKTETVRWAATIQRLFTDSINYAVSLDGIEGPGAYGLNRNVTLTVLICDKQKVVSNFALLQPQLQADGQQMIDAIVKVTGGGAVPTLASITAARRGMMQRPPAKGSDGEAEVDPALRSKFRALLAKNTTEEEVRRRARDLETYLEENPESKKEIIQMLNRIFRTGKLEDYGTREAQEILTRLKAKYGELNATSPESR